MLPISFVNHFTNLNEIHKYNSRQKAKSGFYHQSLNSEFGKNEIIMSA